MIGLHKTTAGYPAYQDATNAVFPPGETPGVLPELMNRLDKMSVDLNEINSVAAKLIENLVGPQPVPPKAEKAASLNSGLLSCLDDRMNRIVDEITCLREAITVLSRLT